MKELVEEEIKNKELIKQRKIKIEKGLNTVNIYMKKSGQNYFYDDYPSFVEIRKNLRKEINFINKMLKGINLYEFNYLNLVVINNIYLFLLNKFFNKIKDIECKELYIKKDEMIEYLNSIEYLSNML